MAQVRASYRPHVVVVGGGFGGLALVRKLARTDVDITLIDRHTYNTFQPLLYQVATASLNPGDITWFLRAVRAKQDNVRFLKGTVSQVDHDAKSVMLEGNITVKYDYLVLANGVTANYFGIPGAEEFAMPLYRRSQALALRDLLFANLENAAVNGQDRDLRVVVVGGGATGVETAGALAEMRNLDMPTTYPELDQRRVHISLVEMGEHVLAPFHPKLREYAKKELIKRGIDLRLKTAVKEVRRDGVLIENDGNQEFLPAGIVVWASGVAAHGVVKDWGVPQGRGGRIEVDEHQRVRGVEGVFAIGDISVNPDSPLPQLGQPAIQAGKHVAKVITAQVSDGRMPKPFKYFDKGTMATIGRASAIAQVRYLPRLKGFPAWFIWVTVHVALLLGNRNRFATMTNLSLKYLLWRSHNAIVGETPYVIANEPKVVSGADIEPVPAKKVARANRKAISKKAQVRKAAAQQTIDEIDEPRP
ncbi:NAD(P)/FAD-dependent oxidoreductase [Aeromicrobium sp. 636]|uniref:NADH:ubiquinone reductase (non-electrogenic) n=1 Tax=Aeromicrobium senzhongii TaxID=2663859 RepID=A0A8I0EVA8_9ACTN|nr:MULTISPECIES: NAD(P)/FAD-dependent oxidoreductase [Aeromicrobium]MBC9226033.1 NAD(P)/FAD-dependent oxidoreductase [Aeromicrobium senzhongii]MCQ3998140.1 NAD(P)/FAD-dependent oxidoreductase [Aeromicrobium sp. 636]MTB88568.1 NAD(P)/FAD-dependent oxidoreductase [Aeromicrobium senzhongii]QNL94118.1 NAD(P)/FAD-dependent oxidoreductase [Aeromicrobium senzhongii]